MSNQHESMFINLENNLDPQKNKTALFVHHSNSVTQQIMQSQLSREGFDAHTISIHDELSEINANTTLSVAEKTKNKKEILEKITKQVKEYLKTHPIDVLVVEANLGFPGEETPTCHNIINATLNSNPRVISTIITNTELCAQKALNDDPRLFYIGQLPIRDLHGRSFRSVKELLLPHNQSDLEQRQSSTVSASGITVDNSPKSGDDSPTSVGDTPGDHAGFSNAIFQSTTVSSPSIPIDPKEETSKKMSLKESLKKLAKSFKRLACCFHVPQKPETPAGTQQITVATKTAEIASEEQKTAASQSAQLNREGKTPH